MTVFPTRKKKRTMKTRTTKQFSHDWCHCKGIWLLNFSKNVLFPTRENCLPLLCLDPLRQICEDLTSPVSCPQWIVSGVSASSSCHCMAALTMTAWQLNQWKHPNQRSNLLKMWIWHHNHFWNACTTVLLFTQLTLVAFSVHLTPSHPIANQMHSFPVSWFLLCCQLQLDVLFLKVCCFPKNNSGFLVNTLLASSAHMTEMSCFAVKMLQKSVCNEQPLQTVIFLDLSHSWTSLEVLFGTFKVADCIQIWFNSSWTSKNWMVWDTEWENFHVLLLQGKNKHDNFLFPVCFLIPFVLFATLGCFKCQSFLGWFISLTNFNTLLISMLVSNPFEKQNALPCLQPHFFVFVFPDPSISLVATPHLLCVGFSQISVRVPVPQLLPRTIHARTCCTQQLSRESSCSGAFLYVPYRYPVSIERCQKVLEEKSAATPIRTMMDATSTLRWSTTCRSQQSPPTSRHQHILFIPSAITIESYSRLEWSHWYFAFPNRIMTT